MTNYIKNSNPCMHTIIPNIVKAKIKEYKKKKTQKKNGKSGWKYACAIQRGPHMQKEVHKHQE